MAETWPRWPADAVQTRLRDSKKKTTTKRCFWFFYPFFLEWVFVCHHEILGKGPWAFTRLKQALWFGMEASLATTKPVQWSSDLQPVSCSAEAEACGFLCLSGWAALRFYQCVQSSMKVIWHDFLFTCHAGGKVLGLRGRRRRKQPEKSNGAGLAGVKTSTLRGSIRDDR